MNVTRIFAVVITLGVLSTASSGQETQKPTTPEGAKPTPAQPAAPPAAAPPGGATQQTRETPPPPPSSSAPKTGVVKDGEFIPTQEIQPDEDVTFPVDI